MKSWVATKPRIENNPQIWTHMAFGMLTLVSLGQSELFKYLQNVPLHCCVQK